MSSKKFLLKLLMVLALLIGASVSMFARDLYVSTNGRDTNPGSSYFPWRTIQYAANKVQPGDVVHVMPGDYYESVYVMVGGTATAPIRFISQSKWQARVHGQGTYPGMQIRYGDYVEINGFDVTGGGYQGIEVLTSYNKVIGNHVHDIQGGCPNLGGAGINVATATSHDNLIDSNVVHAIGNNSGACMLVHGIYTSNARTTITNNAVFRTQGWGIHMWHTATQGLIANNTIFNNDAGGILVGAVASEFTSGTALNDYTVVSNNIVVYNGAVVGRTGISENGATGPHNIYANNLVWKNLPTEGALQTGVAYGTVWADPQFVNYQADGTGDYHLKSTSPAVNAGVKSAPTNPNANLGVSPTYDIEGYSRALNGRWDIGCFEYH